MVSTLLDLLACALVIGGVALLSTPAALIVAGLLLGVVSYVEPWKGADQ